MGFKATKSKAERIEESEQLKVQYQDRIPIIIERGDWEKILPPLSRNKFLVPADSRLSSVYSTLRNKLQLHNTQGLFLLVDSKHIPTLSATIKEIYDAHKDEDGFLYFQYAAQEVYG